MNYKHVGLSVSALTLVATSVMAAGSQLAAGGFNQELKLVNPSTNQVITTEQYIVVFKDGASFKGDNARNDQEMAMVRDGVLNAKAAESVISRAGGKFLRSLDKQRMVVANLSKKAYNALVSDRNVESVDIDHKRYLMAQSTPFGIPMVQATQLTQTNTTARKVCIIDTGYDLGHEDLPGAAGGTSGSVGVWNNDGHGHGTHVAGTIAALDNTAGVIGVYPGVDLHIVKIFNDSGSWTSTSDLLDAIGQCETAGANVVSMSLGGSGSSTSEANAMQAFVDGGMMLVAAAGNDGNSSMSYPASYDAVISVAAVDSSENVASFSQYNSQVEIAAPGVAVNSTLPGDTYASWNGTSMATPHVSGVAALVWSFHQSCTSENIRKAMNDTAKDKGSAGRDSFYGYGIAQALDAKNYLDTWGCAGDPNGGGGGGGGGGSTVELVKGQAETGLAGGSKSDQFFTLEVPAGASNLTFNMSGGTGDADLYVSFGSAPSTSVYECRSWAGGNTENCTFAAPQAGTYHVLVHAYSAFTGASLVADYSESGGGGGGSGDSTTRPDLGATQGNWLNYTVDVPAGMSALDIDITGGTGDADLYVRFGSAPTTTTYDCRPYRFGNEEVCSFSNPQAGTYHIGIRAYSTFSGVTLNTNYQP